MITRTEVITALKTVADPELGINIVDLGLVYGVSIEASGIITIFFTLTSINCPLGPQVVADIKKNVGELAGGAGVETKLVWEPAWNKNMISEEGKFELGMM